MSGYGQANPAFRHGHAPRAGFSPEYHVWAGMKSRCTNPNQASCARYGGAGITVCKRWAESFENFLSDMGQRPPGTSLDRIDGKKGYSKENCRWSTPAEQTRNSSVCKMVSYLGETMPLKDAAKRMGVDRTLLTKRIASGMTPQEAVDRPVGSRSAALKKSWAFRKRHNIKQRRL